MSIDEQRLRELGDVRFPQVVRPAAEVRARARQIRHRRDTLRAGAVAVAVAGVVATVALGSGPWLSAQESPAGTEVPFTPECPQPGGPTLPLSKVNDLLFLPRGVPVASLSAAESARDCTIVASRPEYRDGGLVVAGRELHIEPRSVPAFRGEGDLPGRHEILTVQGVRVDVWRTGGPVPRYRAYWTLPDGSTHGVHAENMDADLRHLKSQVAMTLGQSRVLPKMPPPPTPGMGDGLPPMRYLRALLRPAGGEPVQLTVTSESIGYEGPVGARRVPELPSDRGIHAWWWERDGVGHLDWAVDTADYMASRSLQGRGLTLDRALALARSLEPVDLDDPRLRVGRSGETAPTTGNSG